MPFDCCPICDEKEFEAVYSVKNFPVFNVLPQGLGAEKENFTDIEFGCCPACGHFYNRQFDPVAAERYYALVPASNVKVNQAMSSSEIELAQKILSHSSKEKPDILEIGGGAADLARALSQQADTVTLVDPSPSLVSANFPEDNVQVLNAEFPCELPKLKYDVIVAKQVMEHVSSPISFLQDLRDLISDQGFLYLEVPSLKYILDHASLQDIHFSHVHYFSDDIIKVIAAKVGFDVTHAEEIKGGHDCYFLLKPIDTLTEHSVTRADYDDLAAVSRDLNARYSEFRNFFSDFTGRYALYGAVAYSQSVLSWCGADKMPDYVFDDTPHFTEKMALAPFNEIPILPPQEDILEGLDMILITAYLHDEVISKKLRNMGFAGDIKTVRAPNRLEQKSTVISLFSA